MSNGYIYLRCSSFALRLLGTHDFTPDRRPYGLKRCPVRRWYLAVHSTGADDAKKARNPALTKSPHCLAC